MPPTPRRRAAWTFCGDLVRREAIRADAGPDRVAAGNLAGRGDLRRERRRVCRVGHRADHVDQVPASSQVGQSCSRDAADWSASGPTAALTTVAGRGRPTAALRSAIRRGEPRGAKRPPPLGKRLRVDQRLGGEARVVAARVGRRQIARDVGAKRRERLAAVVEVVGRVADVVEVHAVDRVAADDVAHDGRPCSRPPRRESATRRALRFPSAGSRT